MLKRLNLLALGVACGLALCLIPGSARSSFAAGSAMQQPGAGAGAQQQPQAQPMQPTGEEQPTSPSQPTHRQKQSLLTGKIAVQGGHYVFQNNSNNATLTISNPKKAKKYSGDNVQVKGTVNQQAQTIHISKIKPISS